ncbi:hypothetical protein [Ramlibacter humi]|uniref:hypothetical protein n=1 Tax=Ramlibacter humi TaxID=2530451 RepID=UPI00197E67CC|nr:hypothetical protein [Ramlibacter humi]
MQGAWPWLAVAAAGALHGLNPAAGWAFAAWRSPWRMLAPIAAGHAASIGVVAAAVPLALRWGVAFDPLVPQGLAAALLLAVAVQHVRGHAHRWTSPGRTGLALWSFIVGTAHGAGWMLVPAVVPLCIGDLPGRELTATGSWRLGLAAVGVHLAAMLVATAAMAFGARGVAQRLRARHLPTALSAAAGLRNAPRSDAG